MGYDADFIFNIPSQFQARVDFVPWLKNEQRNPSQLTVQEARDVQAICERMMAYVSDGKTRKEWEKLAEAYSATAAPGYHADTHVLVGYRLPEASLETYRPILERFVSSVEIVEA